MAKAKANTKAKAKSKPKTKPAAKPAKPAMKAKTKVKAAKKPAAAKAATKKAKPVQKSAAKKSAKTPSKKPSQKPSQKPVAKAPAKKAATKVTSKASPKKAAPQKSASKGTAKVLSMDKARTAKKAATGLADFFTPLDNRVLVQRAGVSDRTPGGLFIPDTVSERPNQGKVVAVGPGHRDKKGRFHPLDVQLGDTVMYTPYSGSEISLNGVEVLVLREDEILAIVKS